MCGLVGVISKKTNGLSKDHQDIFSTLLFIDTFRGKDSTGAFVVSNEGDVYVAKEQGMAPNFMLSNEYAEAMRRAWNNGSAVIGHNRAATRGVVNDENAHPFNVDNNIILVHNGTMRSDHKKHADVEVDSHAIAHLIQNKENVSEALSAFYGAYALIWYNVEKGELCMVRNDERPLFWVEIDDAWLVASEKVMLDYAIDRVGVRNRVKAGPTMLTVDVLQRFTLKNKGWAVTDEKVEIKRQYSGNAFTGQQMGGGYPSGPRHSRYYEDMDWGDDDLYKNHNSNACAYEDPPFRPQQSIISEEQFAQNIRRSQQHPRHIGPRREEGGIQLLPKQPVASNVAKIVDASNRMVGAREPVEFAGNDDRERQLAVKQNKVIPHGQYTKAILGQFPYNAAVHATPFDYAYANGRDNSDGYYLYSCPFSDEDVIIRQWFSNKAITEERILQIAGGGYVYEFTLGVRGWLPVNPDEGTARNMTEDTPGFVVIRSNGAKMISTGAEASQVHQ